MPAKRGYRLVFAVVLLACVLVLADGARLAGGAQGDGEGTNYPSSIPPRDGITVVTTDSNAWLADEKPGPRKSSELVAYAPDGSLLYANGSHDRYWDVDPSPAGEATVVYAASIHLSGAECDARTACTRNVVERVDLRTGEVTRLFERVTPYKHSTRWHDVDRLDDDRFVVADIHGDRVFVVNVTTDVVEWSWDAQSAFDVGSGGPFPRDWTHLNDVEVLPDGRIMASLRNQDQVVFLDRERGLIEDWTLGADDDHETLFEQHNPDYIPADRGGPAVLVADSENGRVVEYQRVDGEWRHSWQWTDARMQWPRDADRLPNDNTLIADSHGDRVFEVNRSGAVVWQADVAFPYEVERLATGDESAGGHSAASLSLRSRTLESTPIGDDTARSGFVGRAWLLLERLVPAPVVNSIVYLVPGWVGFREVVAAAALVATLAAWVAVEYRWSDRTVAVRSPLAFTRK